MTGPKTRDGLKAIVLLVVVLLLASCARIPTSGPVGKSEEGSAGNANAPVFFPAAPQPGATPENIIDYFYRAGTGYEGDYAVARQYLTQSSSVAWKPDQRALVYREAQVVSTGVENVYNYQLDIAYTVDSDGIATQTPEGTTENIPVTVTQVDGEWRISDIPDGRPSPRRPSKSFTALTLSTSTIPASPTPCLTSGGSSRTRPSRP